MLWIPRELHAALRGRDKHTLVAEIVTYKEILKRGIITGVVIIIAR